MDCRGLLCGMGNTGSMTSADELNEQYDADGSVTQVPERNDEVHAGESAVAQSRESAVTVPAGTVVLAATPIGNVGDASARLVALLERADIVAAEDTRRLYDLARRLGVYVNGRVIAYHDHNERDKADGHSTRSKPAHRARRIRRRHAHHQRPRLGHRAPCH